MSNIVNFSEEKQIRIRKEKENNELELAVQNSDDTLTTILCSQDHPLIKKHSKNGRVLLYGNVKKEEIFTYLDKARSELMFTDLKVENIGIEETTCGVVLVQNRYSIFGYKD